MAETLVLDDIKLSLQGRELLRISATVAPGETLVVMGPSGSGKSALIAFIAGFLDSAFKASGRVLSGSLDLTGLPSERRAAGILFQDPLLFPHMTVEGNLLFALPEAVRGGAVRRAKVKAALESIGLDGLGARDPDTLSGGQKARVALLRVLLSGPRALLLDEPFSKLDADLRATTRRLTFDRAREARLPVLLVTHDTEDAEAAGGRILRIGS